jgi:NAD(P)-dependent dehydrogenase (short-subunit alcohol dehydrogenase family)
VTLQGKVALITGVGGNIGLTSARRLAESGARLAVADLDFGVAQRACSELDAPAYALDVRQAAQCRELVQGVVAELGGLDVLVNTAGQSSSAPCWTWRRRPGGWKSRPT